MAIKIIERGKIPESKTYEKICPNCNSKLEYKKEDIEK